MRLVLGGVVQRSEPQHPARLWAVDDARVIHWRGPGDETGATVAVPGSSTILTCDPWAPAAVVLKNGEMLLHREVWGRRSTWNRQMNVLEAVMMRNNAADAPRPEPKLAGAWVQHAAGARQIIVATAERRVLVVSNDARATAIGGPVPGNATIVAVVREGNGASVLLDDGSLLYATAAGWRKIGDLGPAGVDDEAGIRLVAKAGFRLDKDTIVSVGDVFRAPGDRARELLRRGVAEPAGPAEPAEPTPEGGAA